MSSPLVPADGKRVEELLAGDLDHATFLEVDFSQMTPQLPGKLIFRKHKGSAIRGVRDDDPFKL